MLLQHLTKGGEDCQFCAPIPDRHKSFCTVGYVSSPAFAKGALSVPDAGQTQAPGCLRDESDRYRLIKVRRHSALHLASTVETVTVAYRAVVGSGPFKFQINRCRKMVSSGGPFTKSRLTTNFPAHEQTSAFFRAVRRRLIQTSVKYYVVFMSILN
jgi:hypothetical protein